MTDEDNVHREGGWPVGDGPAARQQTCEERIASQLASREEDVRKMLVAASGDTLCRNCGRVVSELTSMEDGETGIWVHEDPENYATPHLCPGGATEAEADEDYTEDSLSEFGLSIERKVVLKFLMSTGGPADWLEITCDMEGMDCPTGQTLTVETVRYHFSDWFDHAEMPVDEGTPLYDLAEWIAETQ